MFKTFFYKMLKILHIILQFVEAFQREQTLLKFILKIFTL